MRTVQAEDATGTTRTAANRGDPAGRSHADTPRRGVLRLTR